MHKFWRIFWHEYTRHVLRWRFILVLLSVPLWLGFVMVMAFVGVMLSLNRDPVGYVDHSGTLTHSQLPEASVSITPMISFQPYPGEGEARAALEAEEIQAYFVLPADYLESRQARLVYLEAPTPLVQNEFTRLVRYNLLSELPPAAARRVFNGPNITLEATQEQRSMASGEWMKMVVPAMVGIFLMVSVFSSSGYLMQAVVEEKENRTMEILATSASPGEIMNGKITALILVGMTQVLAWLLPPLGLLALAASNMPNLPVFVDGQVLALALVTALPTFVLISALMATIGATVTEAREGQQMINFITLPGMLPYLMMPVLMSNPGGPIALALSYFPLTASLTLLMRVGFSSVPPWQITSAVAVLFLSAAGALWLSGRVFRLGMLRYGQPLRWKEIAGLAWRRRSGRGSGA